MFIGKIKVRGSTWTSGPPGSDLQVLGLSLDHRLISDESIKIGSASSTPNTVTSYGFLTCVTDRGGGGT